MEGIADAFEEVGLTIFGPSKGAALLKAARFLLRTL